MLVAVAILTYSSLVYFAEREVSQCRNWRNETRASPEHDVRK